MFRAFTAATPLELGPFRRLISHLSQLLLPPEAAVPGLEFCSASLQYLLELLEAHPRKLLVLHVLLVFLAEFHLCLSGILANSLK